MTLLLNPQDLAEYQVSPERGFLPTDDPQCRLPPAFSIWEEIAQDLPKLLVANQLRRVIDEMPLISLGDVGRAPPPAPRSPRQRGPIEYVAQPPPAVSGALGGAAAWERAMLLLSYFGHGYVWGSDPPSRSIPAALAIPWHQVAQQLGRPPVLSYASYALHNWRRIDPNGPIALGNIALLQNFLAGLDEEWFVIVHVDIEAKAGRGLVAAIESQEAAESNDPGALRHHLEDLGDALAAMYQTLDRMPEGCDPYIYYHRVRPYIHGWKNHPVLTEGLVYEGVGEYAGPQQFRGETGAQSSIVPALDAALGIDHREDPLRPYLMEMRDYMPVPHRRFIERLEEGPSVREAAIANRDHPGLRDAYNRCVTMLADFRAKHLEYAARYIQQQAHGDAKNPGQVGTGGTPFMPYLKKHRDETESHLIR